MGVELDLSELAVLRPIQTTATARRGNDDGDLVDAGDDTGCVTPTAMSSLLPRQDDVGVGVADVDLIVDAVVFSTPTSSPCLLRPSMACPPAPRKPAARAAPASAKRKRCGCDLPTFFPVPQDLSTVFVARAEKVDRSPAAAAPPRAAKKVRRLFVVG
ncbi:hypothetical protein HU200_059088 [Digitaria exilis]|uniref:Uncharacterized protein n=1 Tax=Digitaria exilis TaxID=1010633 RepID=A0A835DYM9_9POAL|nr:hypothetical protein HU200_059088 [Digitaria exilis]